MLASVNSVNSVNSNPNPKPCAPNCYWCIDTAWSITVTADMIHADISETKNYHATLMRSAVFICIVPKLAAHFNYFLPSMTKTTNNCRHVRQFVLVVRP